MLKAGVNAEQIAGEITAFLSSYIKVDKVIIFGSYAYGVPREDSDFDIAVISDNFEKMSVLEKMDLFARASLAVDSRAELVGFSKKEFANPQHVSLLKVIKDKGKVVF